MYFCVLYFCIFVKACLPAIKGIAVWFLFTEITQYWNKSHKFQIKIKSNKFVDRNMVEVAQSQSQRFNRHISLNYLQWEKDGEKIRWQKCYFSKTLFHLTKIWWLSVFACVCHIYENTYCEKMRTNRVVIVDLSILKFPTKAKCHLPLRDSSGSWISAYFHFFQFSWKTQVLLSFHSHSIHLLTRINDYFWDRAISFVNLSLKLKIDCIFF